MDPSGAAERGQLIPGLPEGLVVAHVVARLPWYTRPLCRALSKSWRALLDTRNLDLDLRTRMIQVPLLRGLFLFCTFDKQIFIRDCDIHEVCWINGNQIQPCWRKLPPLGIGAACFSMVASSGMVYMWIDNSCWGKEGLKVVWKLDLGRGDWTWSEVNVPYAFNSDAITFKDKIYVSNISERSHGPGVSVPRIATANATESWNRKEIVLAHDMMTDICRHMETWDQHGLRVLSKHAHSNVRTEELYSFVKQEPDSKLELLMYDAGSDSWKTLKDVPVSNIQRVYLPNVKLLNSDCFEPPLEMGYDIIRISHTHPVISWLNSSMGMPRGNFEHYQFFDGRHIENLQFINGSMYSIHRNERKKDGDSGLPGFHKMAIMKGRIMVESSRVVWEEVHEIGFFQPHRHFYMPGLNAIDCFTSMA